MKFTSYRNFLQATTNLIQTGWTLYRLTVDENEITKIELYESRLNLYYNLEHHKRQETFTASNLRPFVRNKRFLPSDYETEVELPSGPSPEDPMK